MGLMRTVLTCVFWSCLLFNFSDGCHFGSEDASTRALQDGVAEPRRHRLQLLFPLLLRISTRLATLVPTALMVLVGVVVFVVFSKKALIVSLIALFLTLSRKYGGANDDIYIHKVDSYPEYNDEEHVYYHHHAPIKYKRVFYPPKFLKKADPPLLPSHCAYGDAALPFKPLSRFKRTTNLLEGNSLRGNQNLDAEERRRRVRHDGVASPRALLY